MEAKLRLEYDQWKLVEKIYKEFCQQLCPRFGKNQKAGYEIRNILERFLTSHSNHLIGNWVKTGDKNMRGRLTSDMSYVKKMVEELHQKRKFFKEGNRLRKADLKSKVDNILIRMWNHTENLHSGEVIVPDSIEFGDNSVKFGEVYQKISSYNLKKLQDGLPNNGVGDDDNEAGDDDDNEAGDGHLWTEDDLKLVVLRYKANLIGSQQWGIPVAVYDHLYTNFGARYEAFASPLNSRFSGRDGGHFCSLFQDTDQVFGSLGSFFEVDLLNPLGESERPKRVVWSINPPFIESIMEETFAKVFKAIQQAQSTGVELIVFGVMPGWYDCRAFINLKGCHGLKWLEILTNGGYFYEAEKRIVARFESVAYVIDSLPKTIINPLYHSAFRDMKIDPK